LTASGDDDGLTVSFTYVKDRMTTATLPVSAQDKINAQSTPEFGPMTILVITISILGVLVFSKRFMKN